MQDLTPQQHRRLQRLSKVAVGGNIGIIDELNLLDEKIDIVASGIEDKIKDVSIAIQEVSKMEGPQGEIGFQGERGYSIKGEDGYTPIKGKDYFDGKDYVLTPNDKKEIASQIYVPIVDKIIERVEIIKEQPIDKTVTIVKESNETLETLKIKLAPILNEIYGGLRGQNYGGFIETAIKPGSNITVNKDASGAWVISSTGTGGGSGFQRPLSGVCNGINKTFTWATAPNVIVSDEGRTFQKLQADGVTVNWTGTTTTILTVAPNFDVFSPS